jgi:hypothetical protein
MFVTHIATSGKLNDENQQHIVQPMPTSMKRAAGAVTSTTQAASANNQDVAYNTASRAQLFTIQAANKHWPAGVEHHDSTL